MRPPRRSIAQVLTEPLLPRVQHPLGGLALVWLLINCIVLGGGACVALMMVGFYLTILALGIQVTPGTDVIAPEWQVGLFLGSFFLGMFLGGIGGVRLLQRAGAGTVRFGLLTLALVPLIGTPISVACGAIVVCKWVRKRLTAHERPGQQETKRHKFFS